MLFPLTILFFPVLTAQEDINSQQARYAAYSNLNTSNTVISLHQITVYYTTHHTPSYSFLLILCHVLVLIGANLREFPP